MSESSRCLKCNSECLREFYCGNCEDNRDQLTKQLRLADELARLLSKYGNDKDTIIPIKEALAAYESARGKK